MSAGTTTETNAAGYGELACAGRRRPRRVAWLVNGDETYGVRQAVGSLVGAVRAAGWAPVIFALADGAFAAECRGKGLEVVDLGLGPPPGLAGPLHVKARQFLRLQRYSSRAGGAIAAAIRGHGVEVLHFLWPNMVGFGGAAAREAGVLSVWEMPNVVGTGYPLDLNRRFLQRQVRRNRTLVLANSAYTAGTTGLRAGEFRVMHLGVDPKRFDPATVVPATRGSMGIPDGVPLLAVFGRVCGEKGQDRVVRAVRRIPASEAVHLLLVGGPTEGAFAERIRADAAAGGLADRVHWTGAVADPERYYPAVDVLINSRVDAEPYGLTVVESLMMGTPVLAHALGGPAETVTDGVTGWHYPTPDEGAIAAGIGRALADRGRWPAMRAAARASALERFTIETQAARYMAWVDEALASR